MTVDPPAHTPAGTPDGTIVLFPQRGCRRAVSGHRLRTQWRAELACQDGRLPCTIADLSIAGARLSLGILPEPGARVWLTLPKTPAIPAEVAWRGKTQLGLRFLQAQPWIDRIEAGCPFARER